MAHFGIVHHFPGGSEAQYEASLAVGHPSDGSLPEGQLFHAAGPSDDGWMIVAIHESKESWEQFRDGTLMPCCKPASKVASTGRSRSHRSRSRRAAGGRLNSDHLASGVAVVGKAARGSTVTARRPCCQGSAQEPAWPLPLSGSRL